MMHESALDIDPPAEPQSTTASAPRPPLSQHPVKAQLTLRFPRAVAPGKSSAAADRVPFATSLAQCKEYP